MALNQWTTQIEQELTHAENARAAGNEGMARVCARRAAGLAIRAYLENQNLPVHSSSAYDLLARLPDLPGVSAACRAAADHLLTRVDESFNLPQPVDLIAQARLIAAELNPSQG